MNWISVKERLPETAGDVFLVVVKEGNNLEVDIAEFNPEVGYIDEWVTAYDWGDTGECHITHWTPLPEPPKEEA